MVCSRAVGFRSGFHVAEACFSYRLLVDRYGRELGGSLKLCSVEVLVIIAPKEQLKL